MRFEIQLLAIVALPTASMAQIPPPDASFDPAVLQHALERSVPIDEVYRQQFETCDRTDRFGSVTFPIKRNGKVIWYGCKSDPSRLRQLLRIPQVNETREAAVFEAKLAHDQDGSHLACKTPGLTDQCGTSLMLRPTASKPCPETLKHVGPKCLPVDADAIPYIAIPGSGPNGMDSRAFRTKTGIVVGDFGVIVANGRIVPIIVADTGPAYKIGEGSTALLKALSSDGKPHTISAGVKFVIFPGSSERDLSADTLKQMIMDKALELYGRLDTQAE